MESRTERDRADTRRDLHSLSDSGVQTGRQSTRHSRRNRAKDDLIADGGHDHALGVSPYHDRQRARDAVFYDNDGWAGVAWYGENERDERRLSAFRIPADVDDSPAIGVEHLATRATVGCYDLTPHSPIEIRGQNAEAFLQHTYSNDMRLDVGEITFALLLEEDGGIVGDHIVTRLSEARYFAVASPAGQRSLNLLQARAPQDVAVIDRDSAYAGIGLWGPEARSVAAPLTRHDLSADGFPFFTSRQVRLGGVPVTAMRLSAVGELGWELWTPAEHGPSLWDALWDAGEEHGMVGLGDRAFASLTAEKGNREWGTDIDATRNPYESGLGDAVDMDTDFVGKGALERALDEGIGQKLACVTLDRTHRVPAVDAGIEICGETVGAVVRSEYGYSIETPIAFGYLPIEYVDPGSSVTIATDGTQYASTVREEPLFDEGSQRVRG